MGLVSLLLGLPLAPVRGVVALTEVIRDLVDDELRGSASIRRDLEAAQQAEAAGEISGAEKTEIQRRAAERATARRATTRE